MGRNTVPFRAHFTETVTKLRSDFQKALVNIERRKAFEELVEAWSTELGAMSYAESYKLLDLILLTGSLDNRSIGEELKEKAQSLRVRIQRIEECAREYKK